MAVPSSGPLSLTDIQAEFGGAAPLSLQMYYKGGAYVLETDFAPNVPRSGAISISDFYGARKTSLTTISTSNLGDNFYVLPSTFVGNLIVNTVTGGGGGGGGPDSYPGLSGYPGRTITGGNIAAQPGDIINLYVGAGGGAGGSGGGGGGGGGKIICTKLYELNLLHKDIYLADQAYGAQLLKDRPDTYNGYRAWAEIVVDWMSGQGPKMMPWMSDQQFSQAAKTWSTSWAVAIATPWAEEMAYQIGKTPKGNVTGKAIMIIGMPICKTIGVWQRLVGPSKKKPGIIKGLALVAIFALLKSVSWAGKILSGKKK